MDSSAAEAAAGGARFEALVEPLRADLHRYCARMTGSVVDGEDVVQETLARAYAELARVPALPPLRPWLFTIAHHRAIDHWRRETLRRGEPLDDDALEVAADAPAPDEALARRQAVRAALACFLALAPAQRACVILKDVLDHTLDEIGVELGLSLAAVKAALHRGRAALQAVVAARAPAAPPPPASPELLRYAALFNARDWDGVRALLADDVRLDVVGRRKAAGRREVSPYFSNYADAGDWRLLPARLDGREVLAALRDAGRGGAPDYVVALDWRDGRVAAIRDYRHVAYIARDAEIVLAG